VSVIERKTEAVEVLGGEEFGIFLGEEVFVELVEEEVVFFFAEDFEQGGAVLGFLTWVAGDELD
jgi:hypothetical protein